MLGEGRAWRKPSPQGRAGWWGRGCLVDPPLGTSPCPSLTASLPLPGGWAQGDGHICTQPRPRVADHTARGPPLSGSGPGRAESPAGAWPRCSVSGGPWRPACCVWGWVCPGTRGQGPGRRVTCSPCVLNVLYEARASAPRPCAPRRTPGWAIGAPALWSARLRGWGRASCTRSIQPDPPGSGLPACTPFPIFLHCR